MSKRIPTGITREYLESVALPNHGGRYTPISHKSIIDKVHEELAARGFNVEQELYRASVGGNVANGIHVLDQGTDPDMKMIFVWGNSYDKTMRFKCGVGVYIPKTDSYMFAGNVATYARKHTGKADEEAAEMIAYHLNFANAHYTDLVNTRNTLINVNENLTKYAEITGRLFIELGALNKEQTSVVRDRLVNEVSLFDNLAWNNAWNYYNSVASALRISHPKSWFEDLSKAHDLITSTFNNVSQVPVLDAVPEEVKEELSNAVEELSNQLNLIDVIAEMEAEQKEEVIGLTINDLPENDQEQIYADDIVQEKVNEIANPNEEFFNFGNAELPTFELPDL